MGTCFWLLNTATVHLRRHLHFSRHKLAMKFAAGVEHLRLRLRLHRDARSCADCVLPDPLSPLQGPPSPRLPMWASNMPRAVLPVTLSPAAEAVPHRQQQLSSLLEDASATQCRGFR